MSLDHTMWPWWQQCPWRNAAELRTAMQSHAPVVVDGAIGQSPWPRGLPMLDTLRCQRSDWHDAIESILLSHPRDASLGFFFQDTVSGPTFTKAIAAASSQLTGLATMAGQHPYDGYPRTGRDMLDAVAGEQAANAGPTVKVRGGTPTRLFMVGESSALTDAALHVLGGMPKASVPVMFELAWLRKLAVRTPWVRKAVPSVLFDLATSSRDDALQAVIEWADIAGDIADCADILDLWLMEAPAWFDRHWRSARGEEKAGDVVARARARVDYERATRPATD